jgi:hypothetical protein
LDVSTASSDYIQLYDGDKKTLMASMERIQRTAAEVLEGVTAEGQGHTGSVEEPTGVAVAA